MISIAKDNLSTQTRKIVIALSAMVFVVLAVSLLSGNVFGVSQSGISSQAPQATTTEISFQKATSAMPLSPEQLLIPSIDVNAEVEPVGVNEDGDMGTPSDWRDVSWYQPGFAPGEQGNAVLSGHLDWEENEAVFWDLNKLQTGDVVQVSEGDRRLTYMVTGSKEYDYQVTDTTPIFGKSDVSQLKLITCDGDFIEGSDTYEKRLIITAQLIQGTDGTALPTSTKSVSAATTSPRR